MSRLKILSIRTKLIILIVTVSTINIILASLAHFSYEKHIYNIELKQKLSILNSVTSENIVSSVVWRNKIQSKKALEILKADRHVLGAIVLLPDSTVFAEYNDTKKLQLPDNKILLDADTSFFENDILISQKPMYNNEEKCGTLILSYSLSEFRKKERQYFLVSLYIIGLSLITGSILAFLFQDRITRPIFNLNKVMNRISADKDYSLRSKIRSYDEIGKLSLGFNFMIEQIEQQNNELKKAKNQSDSALKEKEYFLANMTHELRTPLTSIVGLSSLLEETELNQLQKEYLENIKHSSNHLLAIINDLLEFSKLGSGKLILEKSQFSLRKTISRIEKSMEFELRNRSLNFITLIDENIPHVVIGDEYRLNQILINLIGNAIKFTPTGYIKIEAKLISEDKDGIILEFRVIDTGIGIVKEKQNLIFESFTQESSETNRKYGGTGLGLAITKQLVEIQKGNIRVESEKKAGSSFIFTIPYQKNFVVNTQKYQEQLMNLRNCKVLLVDDNPMNLLFTKSILDKNHLITQTCNNGDEALQKIKNDDFKIILLDLHMPQMDGYELTRIIRASKEPGISQIPIIALTAAATLNEIKKCLDSGMNDYLVKPFKKEELLTKIISLLSNRTNISND